jgi:hypothetical protein
MNNELEKYYDNAFTMMASDGWKDLIEDLTQLRNQVNNLTDIREANQLFFRQGQLDILDLILTRKQASEKVYEDLINGT